MTTSARPGTRLGSSSGLVFGRTVMPLKLSDEVSCIQNRSPVFAVIRIAALDSLTRVPNGTDEVVRMLTMVVVSGDKVHAYDVMGPTFPNRSLARTRRVCVP